MLYYLYMVMSSNQYRSQFEQMKKYEMVGNKTVEKLEQSDQYESVRDVAQASPSELWDVIGQNFSDAVQIRQQVRNDGDVL